MNPSSVTTAIVVVGTAGPSYQHVEVESGANSNLGRETDVTSELFEYCFAHHQVSALLNIEPL